jgi:hypothetical protein
VAAEAIVMRRIELSKLGFVVLAAIFAGGAVLGSQAFAQDAQQDQPSVADAARAAAAAKKDKAAASSSSNSATSNSPSSNSSSKTVITEDSIGSGAVLSSKSGSGANSAAAGAESADKFKSLDEAWGRLQMTQSALDQLEPLNKPELVNLVLQGNTSDFPNRAQWEDKLFAAKTIYIQRSRQLVAATQEMLADIADLQKQGQLQASDPRVQALAKKGKQLTQLAARTESDFQSVVNEGKNAVLQASK